MDCAEYLSFLKRDATRLWAAASGRLDAPVPTCPGWSVERLVGHVGRVYRWTEGWVRSGEPSDVERAPDGDAVVAWAEAGLEPLVAALESADPGATVTTWAGAQPAIFWPRRMAIETALHRWDAENAVGETTVIDSRLAVDAIDEALDVVVPRRSGEALQTLGTAGSTMHLHATDVTGEWFVTFTGPPDHLRVERAHAKGDVAARGTASDLLLFLWSRVGIDRLDVFGDASLLQRWPDTVQI